MADRVLPQVATLDKRYQSLLSQRSNWEKHWQELADYMLPRKADITKRRTQGDKRTELIYDSTALHSVELLASSLHGMMNGWNYAPPRCIKLSSDPIFNKRFTNYIMTLWCLARLLFL